MTPAGFSATSWQVRVNEDRVATLRSPSWRCSELPTPHDDRHCYNSAIAYPHACEYTPASFMVNCVMRRDDRWRVRPALPSGGRARLQTPGCCAVGPSQPRPETSAVDVQRRRAATSSGDRRETENCFTALFQSAEARSRRPRSRTTSARRLGAVHCGVATVSATASASDSDAETEGAMTQFDNKPLSRKLRRPTVGGPHISRHDQLTGSPVGLDLDQVDLRRPQTRPRRHTTSTLPASHSADTASDIHEPSAGSKQPPRRRVTRTSSQPPRRSTVPIDLSYLSDYK